LLVEWWIRGQRVEIKAEVKVKAGEGVPVFEVEGRGLSRRVTGFDADLDAPCLSLEVPADIQGLKRGDMSLAVDWRLRVREAFETYLDQGYIATDFVTDGEGETRRGAYFLSPMTDELRDWVGID
jgi:predicted GNAT superfamily acetyltransferase